jgi:hypothetical protein
VLLLVVVNAVHFNRCWRQVQHRAKMNTGL